MPRNVVHIMGVGTIGEPLAHLLLKHADDLGIDEVTFHKHSPAQDDIGKLSRLIRAGGKLVCDKSKFDSFKSIGFKPEYTTEDAVTSAGVIIDATPESIGLKNKVKLYSKYADGSRLFLAQGSEYGFGHMYAFGINDETLNSLKSPFLHIVSCNTHSISAIIKTLASDPIVESKSYLKRASFVCMRRASDVGDKKSISSPEVGSHKEPIFGTHHAKDAYHLFKTKGLEFSLFSSAVKLNTQYMHSLWFHLSLNTPITISQVKQRIVENRLLSITQKATSSEVFQVGRDHGFKGRILNHSVIPISTLTVSSDGMDIYGFAFTPQDGNSLLSSVAATAWFLNGDKFKENMRVFEPYYLPEI
jgi:glyceraldehyde-3-phosphate dehydrogenase type II